MNGVEVNNESRGSRLQDIGQRSVREEMRMNCVEEVSYIEKLDVLVDVTMEKCWSEIGKPPQVGTTMICVAFFTATPTWDTMSAVLAVCLTSRRRDWRHNVEAPVQRCRKYCVGPPLVVVLHEASSESMG